MLKIIIMNTIFIFFTYLATADTHKKTIIKIIDKISGKSYIHEISKDKILIFRNLDISSSQCIIDTEDNNNFASYIRLKERSKDKYIFKGWILSKNISLSQVAHPVYAIKLLECL